MYVRSVIVVECQISCKCISQAFNPDSLDLFQKHGRNKKVGDDDLKITQKFV